MTVEKQIEKLNQDNFDKMNEARKYLDAHLKWQSLWDDVEHNQIKILALKQKAGIADTMRPCDEELLAYYRGDDRLMEAVTA